MSTTKQAVSTTNAPPPAVPVYSQAIIHHHGAASNATIYVSGQLGLDPKTSKFVEGGVAERTKMCLQNMEAVLVAAGSSMDKVLKINAFLTTMDDFPALNGEYAKWFGNVKPARSCVAVKELPMKTDVEIECIAAL